MRWAAAIGAAALVACEPSEAVRPEYAARVESAGGETAGGEAAQASPISITIGEAVTRIDADGTLSGACSGVVRDGALSEGGTVIASLAPDGTLHVRGEATTLRLEPSAEPPRLVTGNGHALRIGDEGALDAEGWPGAPMRVEGDGASPVERLRALALVLGCLERG